METLKYFFVIVLFFLLHATLTAQNVSPQFSELKGMEDRQGNTHLLYRIYTSQSNGPNFSGSNDIYNFIPGPSTDTIFLYDGYTCSIYTGWGATVSAYDIWNNDLSKYIFTGELVNCFEPYFVISRYDSNFVYGDGFTYINNIYISRQNDSLVFALPNLISNDGGFNWDTLQLEHPLVSVSQFDDAVYFSLDFTTSYTSAIFKSTDSGNTFTVVDTGGTEWNPKFYYDIDENHIYRTNTNNYPNRSIKRSANQGNAFTWQSIYSTNNNFYICLDESQSGAIYLADGKRIFYSSDFGTTFNLYKELDNRVVGIYKKPNSDKLYAATKYRIYEITDDTITVIKSLPIPGEILAYYPLAFGSKWIYDYLWVDWNMQSYSDIFFREVQAEEQKPNGKKYFKIKEKYVQMGFENTIYERIDSTEGRVYRYDENCPTSEQLIEDLVMEVGDSTFATRFGYCIEHGPTELLSEQYFNKWGIEGNKRNYNCLEFFTADYFLATDIGLDYFKLSDDNGDKSFNLKGMLKNGIVYGDTTLTDVENESELPKEFSLSQNYPNPFNPSTRISWQSPVSSWQTLKVYDVLGNEVATLVDEFRPAGSYEVEFKSAVGSLQLASGMYFYRLQVGSFVETKKMIIIK
jgi:hypothetical protein